ncbi:NAD(P)-binding protein [Conexibacter sp. W3-3-2]|nr:NAD(P)-binding protein [Conexibacter sp. W3-3-2]
MRVVIVGASHAGAQLCASLRQNGWTDEILLIGDEPSLPYQRPPLSKTFLAGTTTLEDLLIRKPGFYEKEQVVFRQARVTGISREAQTVSLDDGEAVGYDRLVLCVGARPRLLRIPGMDLAGVHYLRDAADIEAIKGSLATAGRAVIVGAGYIGLEAAASLRKLGVEVTVLEAADRVLGRVTAPEVSAFYDRVHREEGVDLRLGVGVAALEGESRVSGVRLADGDLIAAELVIVGVGVLPNVELAQDAGLAVDDGIVVDAHGRTEDPNIFAAGDCASYPDARYDRRVRLESVASAVEHAKSVAATICGKDKAISALPWFWSDQYDIKLQIAGLSTGYDDIVLRGDPTTGRDFACFYFAGETLIAADCVNRAQEFMFSKRAITEGLSPDRSALADLQTPLAALLNAPGSGVATSLRVGASPPRRSEIRGYPRVRRATPRRSVAGRRASRWHRPFSSARRHRAGASAGACAYTLGYLLIFLGSAGAVLRPDKPPRGASGHQLRRSTLRADRLIGSSERDPRLRSTVSTTVRKQRAALGGVLWGLILCAARSNPCSVRDS